MVGAESRLVHLPADNIHDLPNHCRDIVRESSITQLAFSPHNLNPLGNSANVVSKIFFVSWK
jgi:hypothetical protein